MKDIQNKLLASVEKLFERKQFKSLKELLSTMEPADIAEVLAEKAPAERVFLFRLLPKDIAIEVFEFLEGAEREELLGSFTDTEVAAIIEEMSDDDRTALFDELPAKTVKKLLAHLSPEERKLANALLNYQADSAGRIMTPEFIDLKETMTASQALARIRATAAKKETIYTSFVVSPERKLKGTVHLEDLILASPDTPVTDFMDGLPVFVTTEPPGRSGEGTMSKYDLQTIPVGGQGKPSRGNPHLRRHNLTSSRRRPPRHRAHGGHLAGGRKLLDAGIMTSPEAAYLAARLHSHPALLVFILGTVLLRPRKRGGPAFFIPLLIARRQHGHPGRHAGLPGLLPWGNRQGRPFQGHFEGDRLGFSWGYPCVLASIGRDHGTG